MARFDSVPIDNFCRVSATMFRGGAPDFYGLDFISSLGIRSIIDLRKPSPSNKRESMNATSFGVSYFNAPTSFIAIPDASIAVFLAVCLHPRYQPVYLHCGDGADRTGAMVAVYRIAVEGWPFEWAYQEMLSKGFHPWQAALRWRVKRFAERMGKLDIEDRLFALQELVEQNVIIA